MSEKAPTEEIYKSMDQPEREVDEAGRIYKPVMELGETEENRIGKFREHYQDEHHSAVMDHTDSDIMRMVQSNYKNLKPEAGSDIIIGLENKEAKEYKSVSEFLEAFEKSELFNQFIDKRLATIRSERPDSNPSREAIAISLRSFEDVYNEALQLFYAQGNRIPAELSSYSEEAQEKIKKYWNYLENIEPKALEDEWHRYDIERDSTAYNTRTRQIGHAREILHFEAGKAILGKSVKVGNTVIECLSTNPGNEDALTDEEYSKIGRALVLILSEENEVDNIDVYRERRKKEARAARVLKQDLYVAGHYETADDGRIIKRPFQKK